MPISRQPRFIPIFRETGLNGFTRSCTREGKTDESAKVHLRRYARRSSLRRSAATPHSSRLASLATGAFANPSSKPSQTPANDGRINPAECKTVFKYRPDLFFDRLQDMLDTFAILRDILQIQSGIDNSLFHH